MRSAGNTGFDGEQAPDLAATYLGQVIQRWDGIDPEKKGMIRATIPGFMEETAWGKMTGGGAKYYGSDDLPPLNADVYVRFINKNKNRPLFELADHALVHEDPGDETTPLQEEYFPEFEHPDVHVFGRGPFRLVIDLRDDEENGIKPTATFKAVQEVNGQEEDVIAIVFNIGDHSLYVHADNAVGVHSGAITDIDSEGDVQVNGRKVMHTNRPIN